MEESVLGLVRIPPPLPPKTRRLPQSTTNCHLSLDAVGCQQENQHAPPTSTSCTTVYIKSSRDDLTSFPEVTQDCSEIQIGQHQNLPTPPTGHVVKIMINTSEKVKKSISTVQLTLDENKQQSDTSISQNDGCIRINVGNIDNDKEDMMKSTGITSESFIKGSVNERNSNPYFFCTGFQCSPSSIVMSSGQCSPSDTLDSGTCSDLDSTPPPIPKKKNSNEANSVSVTILNGQHKRANSLTSSGADVDSDDNESNISCDSLNSGDLLTNGISDQPEPPAMPPLIQTKSTSNSSFLPSGLLQDIRDRSAKLITPSTVNYECEEVKEKEEQEISLKPSCHIIKNSIVNESTYEDRKLQEKLNAENKECVNFTYDTDKYYKFHLNENVIENECISDVSMNKSDGDNDESFAGYKDLLGDGIPSTIRSAKGTIRGVKNRVRAGIATFLQIQSNTKSYREKDAGKVVVYTTTMGVVRDTYQRCLHVKKILRTHLVKFEERDVFMNSETQTEVRERTPRDGEMCLPQLFVDGQYIGDSEAVERLNESGELRKILKPYKSADACNTCQVCGGYRLLPCPVCNGSKKSVHRNHFTTEFVALKCMNCDEVGLVKCYAC